jgi:signal transduction histidine kinase
MPIRLKINLVFSAIVIVILGIVSIIVYYFWVANRQRYIEARLANVAVTTGRFLSSAETFNPQLIQKIDSLTAIAFARKSVQAYNLAGTKVYSFNDADSDSVQVTPALLQEVREKQKLYKFIDNRDQVYYHYRYGEFDFVIIAAGFDNYGHDALRRLLFILIISSVFGVLIAVVCGYIFSRRLLSPLDKIADEVKEISALNLSRRIVTGGSKDEWYKLADTLNELLNRLNESFDMQKRFIANASHELSTPLTAISSQLEVSLQKQRSAEEYKETIESIHQDIKHLGKLTHTLLEFAKASGTKGGIETRMLRIDEMIMEIPVELAKMNHKYAVTLKFDHLPEDAHQLLVYGNEELLFTALKNIAINACKYSKDQQARISLDVADNFFEISVENSGSHIPADEMEKIFEPFYRIRQSRATGGFGLGLSLAKRIIKLHRGEISVQSENGTTNFMIQLPAAKNLNAV